MKNTKTDWKKAVFLTVLPIAIIVASFRFDRLAQDLAGLIRADVFDIIMHGITNFGSTFVVLIVITSLFLCGKKKREWIPALWSSYIITIIIVFALKLVIARERILGTEFYPFIHILNHSFPSMHAAAAFAAIPILDREYPRLKKFWIAFAVMVAFSRVYLDMHYLSDVITGAFIGFGIGTFFVYLEEKKNIFKRLMRLAGYG